MIRTKLGFLGVAGDPRRRPLVIVRLQRATAKTRALPPFDMTRFSRPGGGFFDGSQARAYRRFDTCATDQAMKPAPTTSLASLRLPKSHSTAPVPATA